jgi:hypothetical protein
MVPASFAEARDQLQEEMKELWDKLMKEYDDAEAAGTGGRRCGRNSCNQL